MRKVFWENPYQTTLDSKVALVNGNSIVPESTIIFSFAGGQESDKATMNGMPVIESRRDGHLIFYTLPDNHGLSIGDHIFMEIDWQRRLRLMRLHFSAELILELVTRKFGFEKIGAHIAEHKARIDFLAPQSIAPALPELLEEFQAIVKNNAPIEKGYIDEVIQRRYWKIENFAQVPCGGTHVNKTGEIGQVSLKREKPGKGIERIEIRLCE